MHTFYKRAILSAIVTLMTLADNGKSKVSSANQASDSPEKRKQCYCLEEVMGPLYNPVMASFVMTKRGEEVVIVAEQRGVVKATSRNGVNTMLDMRAQVESSNDYGDERGLLSAVPSPDFANDGKLYVSYTRLADAKEYTYVSEFTAVGGKVDVKSERFLLRVYQPFSRGNGGPMLFGDDGFLYVVTGDGGAQDDSLGLAQNKNSFYGSVLRIDVRSGQSFTDGDSAVAKSYRIPADNPFVNEANASDEVFAFGFRNMWGCSQDSKKRGGDGRIYCAETGTSIFDEINVIEKGKNYGWNIKEGTMCYNSKDCPPIENEGLPIYEFPHTGRQALVGGYVYRGDNFHWLRGPRPSYVYGDVISGTVKILEESSDHGNWTSRDWPACNATDCPSGARARALQHILAFAQDSSGELYLLMVDALTAMSPSGKMLKMRLASSAPKFLDAGINLQVLTALAIVCLCRWTF